MANRTSLETPLRPMPAFSFRPEPLIQSRDTWHFENSATITSSEGRVPNRYLGGCSRKGRIHLSYRKITNSLRL